MRIASLERYFPARFVYIRPTFPMVPDRVIAIHPRFTSNRGTFLSTSAEMYRLGAGACSVIADAANIGFALTGLPAGIHPIVKPDNITMSASAIRFLEIAACMECRRWVTASTPTKNAASSRKCPRASRELTKALLASLADQMDVSSVVLMAYVLLCCSTCCNRERCGEDRHRRCGLLVQLQPCTLGP